MKATLEFDLSDHDDKMEHLRCVKSTAMALVLWEMTHNAYKKLTSENDSDEYTQGVIETLEHLRDLMEQHSINLDDLIQ